MSRKADTRRGSRSRSFATALAFNRMTATFARVKRHFPVIIATGGDLLVAMGVLIWTGELFQLNIQAQQLMDRLQLNFFNEI